MLHLPAAGEWGEVQEKVKGVGETNELLYNSVSNSCSYIKVEEGTEKNIGPVLSDGQVSSPRDHRSFDVMR